MKKYLLYSIAICSAMTMMTGCTSDDTAEQTSENSAKKLITINASTDNNTRIAYSENAGETAITPAWETTDVINVYEGTTTGTNNTFTYASGAGTKNATFTGSLSTGTSGETLTAFVQQSGVTVNTNGTATVDLGSQDGTLAGAENNNLLYATTTYTTGTNTTFDFAYKMAIVKLTLTLDESLTGASVSLSAENGIYGTVTLKATDGTFSSGTRTYDPTAKNIDFTAGTAKTVYLSVYPGSLTTPKIIINSGDTYYTYSLSDATLKSGYVYKINANITSACKSAFSLWGLSSSDNWGSNKGTLTYDGSTLTSTSTSSDYTRCDISNKHMSGYNFSAGSTIYYKVKAKLGTGAMSSSLKDAKITLYNTYSSTENVELYQWIGQTLGKDKNGYTWVAFDLSRIYNYGTSTEKPNIMYSNSSTKASANYPSTDTNYGTYYDWYSTITNCNRVDFVLIGATTGTSTAPNAVTVYEMGTAPSIGMVKMKYNIAR
jgi:hypothetical protein